MNLFKASDKITIEFGAPDSKTSDISSIAQLFTDAFQQPFSQELWQWKYGNGTRYAVTAWKDGQVIGHYAAVPRTICHDTQRMRLIQITDVMVHPKERAAHGRQGVFFQMASRFLERYVGYDKEFIQAFGFPNERHTRLGVILGLYGRAGKMFDVRWEPRGTPPSKLHGCKGLTTPHVIMKSANSLWQSMCSSLNSFLVGERTGEYMVHRYLQHPLHQYRIYCVYHRITRQKRGLFVLKQHADNTFELMDILAHLKDIPLVIEIARHIVFTQNGLSLFSWMSDAMVNKIATNARITDIQVTIPCITYTPCPKPEELQGKWWLMSGDTDWR